MALRRGKATTEAGNCHRERSEPERREHKVFNHGFHGFHGWGKGRKNGGRKMATGKSSGTAFNAEVAEGARNAEEGK
jgi:hypothetical protein